MLLPFNLGKRQPACLMGWELSINSLLQLWQLLKDEYGYKYLLTNRLNQDCLENLFGVIRGKGAGYDNPDAKTFRSSFAQVCFGSHFRKVSYTQLFQLWK